MKKKSSMQKGPTVIKRHREKVIRLSKVTYHANVTKRKKDTHLAKVM